MSQAPSKRRRYSIAALKIILGLAILYFILIKLSLNDQVDWVTEGGAKTVTTEGKLSGGDPTIVVLGANGERHGPFGWDKDEVVYLLHNDGGVKVRTKNGQFQGVGIERTGHIALLAEGEASPTLIPFEQVLLTSGNTEGGFTERLLGRREGLRTIFSRLSIANYGLAMASILAMYLLGIKRWQILLKAQGLPISFFEATRLTFIGFFFNNVVPGMTGGDVVKAVLVARAYPGRGPDAVATVIVDRVLGLVVLAGLAAGVLMLNYDTYQTVAFWVFLFLGLTILLIVLFLSRRVRRFLRIDRLLNSLPGSQILKRLDLAFLNYRNQGQVLTVAVLLSLGAHVANILSVYFMGIDLGVTTTNGLKEPELLTYMATVPIVMIVSSIPLLPGGWGLGEAAFGYFFRSVGIRNLSLSVGLSVLHRFSLLVFSLVGGVFLLFGRANRLPVTPTAEETESALA
jgi:uncharacterized protein (TIRG00374 family)